MAMDIPRTFTDDGNREDEAAAAISEPIAGLPPPGTPPEMEIETPPPLPDIPLTMGEPMVTALGEPQATTGQTNNGAPSMLGLLREIRVEILGLQQLFQYLSSGSVSLPAYAGLLKTNVDEIDGLMKQLGAIPYQDAIDEIRNTWQMMRVSPVLAGGADPAALPDAQLMLNQAKVLNDQCKRIIYLVGYITIPGRLEGWLKLARPGYYIPFHSVFEDEVPDRDDRDKILNALAWAPDTFKGALIDVTSGLVYKYNTDAGKRLLSLGAVVLGLVVSVLFIVALCNAFWLGIIGWPFSPADVSTLLGAWGAVLLGIVVHMGVGMAKRAQSQTQLPPVYAPSVFLAQIDAHLGSILYKLFLALVGLFGLVGFLGMDQASPFNAFLTGYSLDSVIELIGSTLDRQSSSRMEALRSQLTPDKQA
jgi:hypothetical protein